MKKAIYVMDIGNFSCCASYSDFSNRGGIRSVRSDITARIDWDITYAVDLDLVLAARQAWNQASSNVVLWK